MSSSTGFTISNSANCDSSDLFTDLGISFLVNTKTVTSGTMPLTEGYATYAQDTTTSKITLQTDNQNYAGQTVVEVTAENADQSLQSSFEFNLDTTGTCDLQETVYPVEFANFTYTVNDGVVELSPNMFTGLDANCTQTFSFYECTDGATCSTTTQLSTGTSGPFDQSADSKLRVDITDNAEAGTKYFRFQIDNAYTATLSEPMSQLFYVEVNPDCATLPITSTPISTFDTATPLEYAVTFAGYEYILPTHTTSNSLCEIEYELFVGPDLASASSISSVLSFDPSTMKMTISQVTDNSLEGSYQIYFKVKYVGFTYD